MADENMVVNAIGPHGVEQENESNMEIKDEIDVNTDEEFTSLNAQLDQLHSVLDELEMKNNEIHAEFVKLLKSNKETRQEFQESSKIGIMSSKESDSH